MSNEVELKFLVLMGSELNATEFSEKITDNITQLLQQEDLSFQYQLNKLTNCYFDTADQALRQLDFGLRIRRDGDHIEQTIKTAGVIIGGLHQRPEYNLPLEGKHPDLSLFDAAGKFLELKIRRFPVLKDGRLIGQISLSDVIRAFPKLKYTTW